MMKKVLSVLMTLVIMMTVLCAHAENVLTPIDAYEFANDGTYIFGVLPGRTCQDVLDYCNAYGGAGPYFRPFNGSSVSGAHIVCTGMVVNYNHGNDRTVVVYGDVDGNGVLNVGDIMSLRRKISSTAGAVTDAGSKAGDVNYSGTIDDSDISMINDFIMNGGVVSGTVLFSRAEDCGTSTAFSSSKLIDYIHQMGYSKNINSLNVSVCNSKSDIVSGLQTSKIYNYMGHGAPNAIKANLNEDDNGTKHLTIARVEALTNTDFTNCRFAYFTCCNAAYGGATANNVLRAIYRKGVRTVIGYSDDAYDVGCKIWAENFYKYSAYGHTVREAAFEANCYVSESGYSMVADNVNDLVIYGDQNQRLAHPLAVTDGVSGYSLNPTSDKDILSAFNSNIRKELNQENVNGYYNLSALRDSGVQSFSTKDFRKAAAENALAEYIDVEEYDFVKESYNESLNIYTLYYSKLINGVNSTDSGIVMLNDSGQVACVKTSNTGMFDGIAVSDVTDEQIEIYISEQNIGGDYSVSGYIYDIDENENVVVNIVVEKNSEILMYTMPL